jgi:S-adenosylmethionine hydrolase
MRRSTSPGVRRITLLTDFGTADGYVAALRGVIAATTPDAVVQDAAHDIPPGDVEAAAFVLARYAHLFPPGTVHLVVVDPGVGTARRAIAASVDDQLFVAPDNGVLSYVLARAQRSALVALENPRHQRLPASATFHGRDIFAPAAAHLAAGAPLTELGSEVRDPVLLDLSSPVKEAGGVCGVVVHVDRFGNLISNIPAQWIQPGARVAVDAHQVGRVRRTYGDAGAGEVLALIGSDGLLEVGVRDGNAARTLAVGRGAVVRVSGEQ